MVRKITFVLVVFLFSVSGMGHASGWEANLNAGNTSAFGGLHYKRDFHTGFLKFGGSGLYTKDNDLEYKWAEIKFVVGRDNIKPGLSCEIGLKGIIGNGEEDNFSGDLSALAFTGQIGYLFPKTVMPVPLELFTSFSYAPSIISFQDADGYIAYNVGIGVRIIENATAFMEYAAYDVDMDAGPGPWNLDDGVIRLGLALRF